MKKFKMLTCLLLMGFSQSVFGISDASKSSMTQARDLVLKANVEMAQALSGGDISTYNKAVSDCELAVKTLDNAKIKEPSDSGIIEVFRGLVIDNGKSYFDEKNFTADSKDEHNKSVKFNGEKYKVTAMGKGNIEAMEIYEKGMKSILKEFGIKN